MKRMACLAATSCLLAAVVAACSGSNKTGTGGDAGSSDSGSGSGGSGSGSGSGSSSGSSSGGSTDGGRLACDSGGPLVLEAVWELPTVTPSGVAFDAQGDVYVAGIFNGTATFGTTTLTAPTAPGTENMFLVKYDAGGNVLFAKGYGTSTGIYINPAMAVDPAGNVFLGGAFADTLDFGGSTMPLSAIGLDAFAVKISPSGTSLWADHFGYNGGPYAVLSIAVGPDGNPVVAGSAAGTIILGGTTWTAPASGGDQQPFLAKLATADGSVVWSNATGGDIVSGEDIWVAIDSAGRVFVAARVESGGGAWGVEPAAGAGNFATMRAGFGADGKIAWGQFDYGAFPMAAAIDSEGRVAVVENAFDTVVVGGTGMFGDAQSGDTTLSLLFSPVDGTLLSGLNIGSTFLWSGAADSHGNTLLTGTYWPKATPLPVGSLSLPAGGGSDQPLFVAALDGVSNAVAVATLGASNDAQPLFVAVDPGSGKTFVAATLGTAFTSTVGPLQPGALLAIFGPDPCDNGAGPPGASTGNPSNHGDLSPDGGSPYMGNDGGSPAACPASAAGAVNGAACPVAMGCSYGTTCCFCSPMGCGGASTTWTCDVLQNDASCPASPPSPGGACSPTSLSCNYCLAGGRFFAQCTGAGWSTGYAQIVCQ
jgi:hypothetical protein